MHDDANRFLLPDWPRAYGGPSATGNIKSNPDDFIVEETLSFTPEGHGEHIFLYVEKVGENTEYIARLLARHAGVRQRDIGYAGLKDRHGRTRQWFSVWLPGKDAPDWQAIESERLTILQAIRHPRKLKRGVLAGNRFVILIRHWQGNRVQTEHQLQCIQATGFPNYFGEQRFGHRGGNIEKALALFQGQRVKPEQRSIYLSAARSLLFNDILAARVTAQTWNQALSGDVFQLEGSHSHFLTDLIDAPLIERVRISDIHPTGALWGRGSLRSSGDVATRERACADAHPVLVTGLECADLSQDRRALRVKPENLSWHWSDDGLNLAFTLPAGSYATALLREIIVHSDLVGHSD
ncbi:MAG: tRNA pseudouridine(13) synthase TruD [Methylomonas sp.]|nr:tRNA pseudouridine(13) synthase TruD [Methylomonas sp.]PPD19966.1 MAG: tRNA pseudouridine(13) synthase TruD [Methylomonas sp.]PPD26531.1 MAG: tRNA pseudouridine(13) synthase TruD [Methylomonas sp.]PPD36930.1 MAG: tRNA pseudouridine(13) synthase TruD [Methylomonas sp.]PPD38298.1 MAG: tRNA pseudouridine(13) synthase TruD [Methylomonas sp.]